MAESITCDECGKPFVDGEQIEVVKTATYISVLCRKHAIWHNRKAIEDLLRTTKERGDGRQG